MVMQQAYKASQLLGVLGRATLKMSMGIIPTGFTYLNPYPTGHRVSGFGYPLTSLCNTNTVCECMTLVLEMTLLLLAA
jgi:hypothetical protein